MPDEQPFSAADALAAIDADRDRLRRRVRAANRWYLPGLASLIALSVAGPALERSGAFSGFWVSIAALGGILALTGLRRWRVGVAERLSFDAASITVVVLMIALLLGLFVVTLFAERFGFEHLAWPSPAIAFGVALGGCLLLDRLGTLGSPRAR